MSGSLNASATPSSVFRLLIHSIDLIYFKGAQIGEIYGGYERAIQEKKKKITVGLGLWQCSAVRKFQIN